jgi:hypothetical protein
MDQKNITALNRSTLQLFKAATQQSTKQDVTAKATKLTDK